MDNIELRELVKKIRRRRDFIKKSTTPGRFDYGEKIRDAEALSFIIELIKLVIKTKQQSGK